MALHVTLESGMPIARALRLSLAATGNAAFTQQTETVTQAVKQGEPVVEALTRSRLFSTEFLSIVAVGERGRPDTGSDASTAEILPRGSRPPSDHCDTPAGFCVADLRPAPSLIWAIFSIAGIYLGALRI